MKGKIGAVGMFDGVHRGHRYLLGKLMTEAQRLELDPVAITFTRHPLSHLSPERCPAQLTTPLQREKLLRQTGVDVLPFEFNEIRELTAAQFLTKLHEQGFRALVMGFNNHIGSDRLDVGAASALKILDIIPCDPAPDGMEVSSTAVRAAVSAGDMRAAAEMLGRPFRVAGRVEHGQGLGHSIGFPTANINPSGSSQLFPAPGVYAVKFRLGDASYQGMANLGSRPTVDGRETTLEVNVFDFEGDLYGSDVEVEFIERMRSEKRFPSDEALKLQLVQDKERALRLMKRSL